MAPPSETRVVVGIDPGTLVTGYGVVSGRGERVKFVACGAIRTRAADPLALRLHTIHRELLIIFRRHRPEECAVESAFYGKNAQSALKLGHARGVALLAAVQEGIPTTEYAPRAVKKAIVGNGAASKQQVQYMVRSLLEIPPHIMRHDASDALAIALCHLQRLPTEKRARAKDWASYIALHPERVLR
jgi:crossover junction endodeoxyribonuclease RuvC